MNEVSVIIPTYNRSKVLVKAVESVLNQTYENFELIIVDDKSKDDTADTVEQFKDPRIKYHRNEINLGGSGSRNVGIELAKGEFIAFLDDDDQWLPEKLERQVEVLKKASAGCCGVYTGLTKYRNGKPLTKKMIPRDGMIFNDLLWENIIGSTSVIMLRKKSIIDVGGFTQDLPASQELDLYLRLAKKYEFKCVPESLVVYHIHQDNQITSDYSKKVFARKYIYNKYRDHIIKDRGLHARHLYEIGFLEYMNGDREESFRHLKMAFLLSPPGIKHLIRKILSKLILDL
ncbi:MAG: glycosyltransferase family 2 protein [Thermoplasmata archaeon]